MQQPEPDREWQPDERGEDDDQDAEQKRAEDVGKPVDDPEDVLARRRERQQGEECQPEQEIGEDHAVARVVVAAFAIGTRAPWHAWGVARTRLTRC